MKKNIFFAAVLILLVLLSSCSADDVSYTNVYENAKWERNPKEHWITGENGEILELGEHTNNNFCTVCGCEIMDWGDCVIVSVKNEWRDVVSSTAFGTDGSILSELTTEYEYDADGYYTYSKTYENGILTSEYEYTLAPDGFNYPVKETLYFEDGFMVNSFDESANLSTSFRYDVEGNVIQEYYYENAKHPEGYWYTSKATAIDHVANQKTIEEYDDHCELTYYFLEDYFTSWVEEHFYEYEYDEQNRLCFKRHIYQGMVYEEITFGFVEEEGGWQSYFETFIVYGNDGSYTVEKYDPDGNLLSKTHYEAEE